MGVHTEHTLSYCHHLVLKKIGWPSSRDEVVHILHWDVYFMSSYLFV